MIYSLNKVFLSFGDYWIKENLNKFIIMGGGASIDKSGEGKEQK